MAGRFAIADFAEPDWPDVWRIVHAVTAAGDTYPYPTDLAEAAARDIWIERPPGRTVVARDESARLVATAKMGANRAGPGDHVATASFMVAEEARGRGAGRALVLDALDWARARGFRAMQFNAVAATNRGAIGLYQDLGFAIVGTVPAAFRHPRHGFVALHVMHRPLP